MKPSRLMFCLLSLLLGVNLIQAIVTQLNYDEAYYWLFAQRLDWGYFDHPPMTPFLLKLGTLFGGSELFVRLLFLLLQPLYLGLFWKMIKPEKETAKEVILYVALMTAVPLIQIYGFLATPDVPLMFFSTVLLYTYKRFTERESTMWALALGVAMGCLAYSKYHGALVVAALMMSNPSLLKSWRFYLASAVALLLFLPHLAWQYQHDFISFDFHLHERSDIPKFRYITEYLLNTFLTLNPFLFPLMCIAWWRARWGGKPSSRFSASLLMLPPLFVVFFFLSSFRGHAQPQWIFPAVFGLVYVLFNYVRRSEKLTRYVLRASLFTWVLFVVARVLLPLDCPLLAQTGFNHNRRDMHLIGETAGDNPVIFRRYLSGGLYTYYTGKPCSVVPDMGDRQSQFDMWRDENSWGGKRVLVEVGAGDVRPVLLGLEQMTFTWTDDFIPTTDCTIDYVPIAATLRQGEQFDTEIRITNPYPYPLSFDREEVVLHAGFIDDDEDYREETIRLSGVIAANATESRRVVVTVPSLSGSYRFGFALQHPPLSFYFCSPKQRVEIN